MYSHFIKKSIVALALLIPATLAFAKPDSLPCPSLVAMQQAVPAMNAAILQDNGTYTVTTASHLPSLQNEYGNWSVTISSIYAASVNEAIVKGKQALLDVSISKTKVSNKSPANLYLCLYGPDDIAALAFA